MPGKLVVWLPTNSGNLAEKKYFKDLKIKTISSVVSPESGMDSRNEANAISVFDLANRPIIIAHRGYSKEFPENTLLSFR